MVRFLTYLISFYIVVIVKFNRFVSDIHEGKRYGNVEFDLIDKDGNIIEEKGAHLIFDGRSKGGVVLVYTNLPQSHVKNCGVNGLSQ